MKANDRALSSNEAKEIIRFAEIDQALQFPRIHRAYQQYRSTPRTQEWLDSVRAQRLYELLDNTVKSVPAYRDVKYKSSAAPEDALLSFEPIGRQSITANFIDHCSDDIDPAQCKIMLTSGTTGQPFKFIRSRGQMIDGHALRWLIEEAWGIGFSSRVLRPCQDWLNDWFEHTSSVDRLYRIAEFGNSAEPCMRTMYARRSSDFNPDVVMGHPTYLLRFLSLMSEFGLQIGKLSAVLAFGENMTPDIRRKLQSGFGAPVCDTYGLREFGTVAAQNPICGNYHITDESLWVEILDEEGARLPDGESGEIVITGLKNQAMPLIRYRTGDHALMRRGECDCGNPHAILDGIQSRAMRELVTPAGVAITIARLSRVLRAYHLNRIQFVKERDDHLLVKIDPAPEFASPDVEYIRRNLEHLLSNTMTVSVRVVDPSGFDLSPSGKSVDYLEL